MGHSITALLVPEPYDERAARAWDVVGVPLPAGLRLVHLDHYYSAYWQARRGVTARLDVPPDFPGTFPREGVVAELAAAVAGTTPSDELTFALLMTDYFGGIGEQWACAFAAGNRVPSVRDINGVLRVLGVRAVAGSDEFDTVGLGQHRTSPAYLERYPDLCDELGV
ncbi:hypothetical protein [Cryptosporangium minutisporangium]|uniref:Uncharacterized protein n=1 Tax=Cryptosporangium minutisporangium TaxID=113569 RepID=A0ABP6T125_9ACTN